MTKLVTGGIKQRDVELSRLASVRQLKQVAASRGIDPHLIEGFSYQPCFLSKEEYRAWYKAAYLGQRDPITGDFEPHSIYRPYLATDGTALVYNIVKMWSGKRYVLHPPVRAPVKEEQ
jgi:hypothetical protein